MEPNDRSNLWTIPLTALPELQRLWLLNLRSWVGFSIS